MLHLVERSKLVAEGLKIRRAHLDGNGSGLVATFILVRLSVFVDEVVFECFILGQSSRKHPEVPRGDIADLVAELKKRPQVLDHHDHF